MLRASTSPPPPPPGGPPLDPDTPSGKLTSHKKSSFHLHRLLLLPLPLLSLLLLLPSPKPIPTVHSPSSCPFGHVYVYDLPASLNTEIISSCRDLNPWFNLCPYLSNSAFGPHANLSSVVPTSLLPYFFSTYEYSGEIIFHNRLLHHPCRTKDKSTASAFYIPFYAGFSVGKHLWNSSSDVDEESNILISWLQNQPTFVSSGGNDHFLMIGRVTWDFRSSSETGDWGGSLLKMRSFENVTHLVIEKDPWDPNDVGVPHLTGFHPKTKSHLLEWQNFVLGHSRPNLFGFAGAPREEIKNDFRKILLDDCLREKDSCKSVVWGKGNGIRETTSLFLGSKFCLQPRGDSLTRRSMFDCMIAGSIPVVFWRGTAYGQFDMYFGGEEEEEWSVFLDRKKVRRGEVRIREFLEEIDEDKVKRMREKVVSLIPTLVYGGAEDGIDGGDRDAVDMAVDGVMRRFGERRQNGSLNLGGSFVQVPGR